MTSQPNLPICLIASLLPSALRSLKPPMIPIRVLPLAFLMVLWSASSFLPAQTAGAPLTLQQAIALARAKNPALLSGQQHVIATRASEVTAGLRQNPSLTLSGTDVTLAATIPATLTLMPPTFPASSNAGRSGAGVLTLPTAPPTLPKVNTGTRNGRPSLP